MTLPSRTRRPRLWQAAAAVVLAAGAATGSALTAPHASAADDPDWFKAGSTTYASTFADPDVLKVGSTYYAYATGAGGAYLPVMHSTDLKTWTNRAAYVPNGNGIDPKTKTYYSGIRRGAPWNDIDPFYNDALPALASWAYRDPKCNPGTGKNWCATPWAPTVERLKNGRYLLAYALPYQNANRRCISVATSASPEGPFVDSTTAPVICSSDPNGSIDPDLYRDPRTGLLFMLWKNEGVPGKSPTKVWTWVVNEDGAFTSSATTFQTKWKPWMLMQTAWPWEGSLIENPSMVYYQGKHYLFYSGNFWKTPSYAEGEAMCDSANSPCGRAYATPVLQTTAGQGVWGPGGGSAFVDGDGRLRLGYAAWNEAATGTEYPNPDKTTARRTFRLATMGAPDSAKRVPLAALQG